MAQRSLLPSVADQRHIFTEFDWQFQSDKLLGWKSESRVPNAVIDYMIFDFIVINDVVVFVIVVSIIIFEQDSLLEVLVFGLQMRSRSYLYSFIILLLVVLYYYYLKVAQIVLLSCFRPLSNSILVKNGTFTRFQLVCDRRTDRRTDGRTDTSSYRDARTHLINFSKIFSIKDRNFIFNLFAPLKKVQYTRKNQRWQCKIHSFKVIYSWNKGPKNYYAHSK